MKIKESRWVCLLLVSVLLAVSFPARPVSGENLSSGGGSVNPAVIKSNTGFAFDIFKVLNREDSGRNIFISPLSVATALTMVYEGAGTSTRTAMASALHYNGLDTSVINDGFKTLLGQLRRTDGKNTLNIGNSIWIRNGFSIQKQFLSVNRTVFDASVTTLDFSKSNAADTINRWVSDATKGKINKMVSSPISRDIVMYLINAVYFKGEWETKFDTKRTFEADFTSAEGKTRKVMMMSRQGSVEYGRADGCKVVRLPYAGGSKAMYCILPDEGTSLYDWIGKLGAEDWDSIRKSVSKRDEVQLQLPRFKMDYGIRDLKSSLTALGMGKAFTDAADFSGIAKRLCINKVLHKAVIDVNEEGSEAAAATAAEMRLTAVAEPLSFIANRPFLFVIADAKTDAILFMGALQDPG